MLKSVLIIFFFTLIVYIIGKKYMVYIIFLFDKLTSGNINFIYKRDPLYQSYNIVF